MKYRNPILYADLSDPDLIRVGEDYYMTASSFTYVPGLPVLHSKDLIHWEIIGNAAERLPDERYNRPAYGCGIWAPQHPVSSGTVLYLCLYTGRGAVCLDRRKSRRSLDLPAGENSHRMD